MKVIKKTIQTRPGVNCVEVCNPQPHSIFLVFSCPGARGESGMLQEKGRIQGSTWWYWVSLGHLWLVPLELGQYWVVLFGTLCYWVSIWGYLVVLGQYGALLVDV